jgi:hypothetical protein
MALRLRRMPDITGVNFALVRVREHARGIIEV